MRSPLKALVITGSLAAAIPGAAVPRLLRAPVATAAPAGANPKPTSSPSPTPTPAAPTLITTNFACSSGVCAIGPGNVGISLAAGLDAAVTSTGKVIFSNLPSRTTYPIDGFLIVERQLVPAHRDQQPRVFGHRNHAVPRVMSARAFYGAGLTVQL